jgi:hypothetical protein
MLDRVDVIVVTSDVEAFLGADVIVRVEPGDIRAWDYADELGTG